MYADYRPAEQDTIMDESNPIAVMDDRLKLLSYSFQTLLHTCPRRYQLSRLRATEDEQDPLAVSNQNVTFAFGHIVGEGIQMVLEGKSETEIMLSLFLGWHADLEDRNEKQVKSFYHAVAAVQKFQSLRDNGFLDEWEVVEYDGKPAIELSFLIVFPDGFKMRGSVDAILRNKLTGEIMVLECKTSSFANLVPATYKNSSQALGYSVILDIIFPELSSYKVMYMVYLTKPMNYEILPFTKSYTQRAQWIQELLLDIEILKLYETTGVYPMYGHSCYSFFRDCEYLSVCTLATKHLTTPQTEADNSETNSTYKGEYTITLSLMDLINGQLRKNERAEAVRLEHTNNGINFDESDELL